MASNEEIVALFNQRFNQLEEKLVGLLEINNRLVHENLLSKSTEKVKSTSSTEATPTKVIIAEHGKGFKVYGKTYPHRSLFREQGGSWNKSLQGWVFSEREGLEEVLKENNIEYEVLLNP